MPRQGRIEPHKLLYKKRGANKAPTILAGTFADQEPLGRGGEGGPRQGVFDRRAGGMAPPLATRIPGGR